MIKNIVSKGFLFVIPALICIAECEAQSTVKKVEPGINVSNMDKKTKPNENFFRFVNGTWLDKTEIPSDRTSWGSFNELREKTDKDALAILKAASKNPVYNSNTDQGKAVNLFKSIMDTVARDKAGIVPLKPYLAKIEKVKNVQDLQNLLVEMEPVINVGFFGVRIAADKKDSNK